MLVPVTHNKIPEISVKYKYWYYVLENFLYSVSLTFLFQVD